MARSINAWMMLFLDLDPCGLHLLTPPAGFLERLLSSLPYLRLRSPLTRMASVKDELRINSAQKRGFNAMYRKRRKTCIKKVHELATKCSADVYLLVCKDERYTIYNSSKRPGWPPPDSTVVWFQL